MNSLILYLSKSAPFRGDLDYHLIRAVMVFTFYIFSYQKWFSFEAHQIAPFISHSPLVFWLIPAFGVRGAAFFLGTTECAVRHADLAGLLVPKAGHRRGARLDRHFSWHRHDHPIFPQRMGDGGRRISGHVFAGRLPDEGLPLPRGLVLPPQAGSDA